MVGPISSIFEVVLGKIAYNSYENKYKYIVFVEQGDQVLIPVPSWHCFLGKNTGFLMSLEIFEAFLLLSC